MKRILIAAAVALTAIQLGAQVVDDGSRDRSKYANDTFRDDDRYMVEKPYATVSVDQVRGNKVKNVIYMIGDGMSTEHIGCCWVLNGGHLNMDNFIYTGFSRTYTTDKLITDSCAGGSALSTGVKTRYGYMALDSDGNPVPSVLKDAQEKGMKTGVIATCRINDATPFVFCGHSADRHEEEQIASQYPDCGVDFISGGGIQFWVNRSDGRNLVDEMKAKGYSFASTTEELVATEGDRIVALLADTEMDPALERGDYLEKAAMKAIETLDNKKGFFLMIEGSCIDDWSHKQKIGYTAEEFFDFDRTVGKVLEWAEKDGHTLVVVTADHCTGGLSLIGGDRESRSVKVHFSTKGHNGVLVPVMAYGPGAKDFTGYHENCEIGNIVRKHIRK